MPEQITSRADGSDPEHEAILADSVGLALLVVLETLAPAERLAFVLHDIFAVPFDEIALIRGALPNCGQAAREPRTPPGAGNGDGSRRRSHPPARSCRRLPGCVARRQPAGEHGHRQSPPKTPAERQPARQQTSWQTPVQASRCSQHRELALVDRLGPSIACSLMVQRFPGRSTLSRQYGRFPPPHARRRFPPGQSVAPPPGAAARPPAQS